MVRVAVHPRRRLCVSPARLHVQPAYRELVSVCPGAGSRRAVQSPRCVAGEGDSGCRPTALPPPLPAPQADDGCSAHPGEHCSALESTGSCAREEAIDNGDWYGKSWEGIYVDTEVRVVTDQNPHVCWHVGTGGVQLVFVLPHARRIHGACSRAARPLQQLASLFIIFSDAQ